MSLSVLRHRCFGFTHKLITSDLLKRTSNTNQLLRYSINNGAQNSIKVDPSKLSESTKVKLDALKSWSEMSRKDKFKILVKDYGKTIMIFHITISLISLGCFYTLVSKGVDMTWMIEKIPWGKSENAQSILANSSTFVVAYAIHKLFSPVRLYITVLTAPIMVRVFRKYGIIKPAAIKHAEAQMKK